MSTLRPLLSLSLPLFSLSHLPQVSPLQRRHLKSRQVGSVDVSSNAKEEEEPLRVVVVRFVAPQKGARVLLNIHCSHPPSPTHPPGPSYP